MKKGRHRRYEEARRAKRSTEVVVQRCAECGAGPEEDHASWCLAEEELEEAEPMISGLPTASAPAASGHTSIDFQGPDFQGPEFEPASRVAPDHLQPAARAVPDRPTQSGTPD
ncbi:MAG: hypothetical protein DLM54_05840 [Acidimicrobiales bacterium]|nr:MAG: hypothetical protein DLM54_05840 [Acidimicrobiales bacterium]